jgi:endogenous inhibitor of DNA gyrase (YacG/DUF329 family)
MPVKPPDAAGPAKRAAKPATTKAAPAKSSPAKPSLANKPCPICGKPATEASHPFCSERCRDVDLNRWLSNSYVIPAARSDDEDAE